MANLQVVIGGQDLSAYVERLERENHLCQPGHTFTLSLATNVSRTNLNPWATVVLHERGVKVLTGYVDQVYYRRPPAKIIVRGKDNWKRAAEWFIGEQLYSTGEQVGAWVNYFCNLVGLTYVITATSGSTNAVKDELPLGMKHVSEALLSVCAYAGWCIRVRPDGVVDFRPTNAPISPDYTLTTNTALDDERNDFSTRNVVKVYGLTSGSNLGPLYKETRAVPGISGERIMVFGDPNIDTYDKASKLGRAALDQFADLERRTTLHVIGNPNFQVGDSARFYPSGSSAGPIGIITDLSSEMSTDVYRQNLTIGRRCFRLPIFGVRGYYGSTPVTSGSSLNSGILSYWKFDEASGTRQNSVSSGSLFTWGGDTGPDGTDTGIINAGAKFNELPYSDHYGGTANDIFSLNGVTRTFAFWAKLYNKNETEFLLARYGTVGGSPPWEWDIRYNATADRLQFGMGSLVAPLYVRAENLGSPGTNTFYFIICTRRYSAILGESYISIRINLLAVDKQFTDANIASPASPEFTLGANEQPITPVNFLRGVVDEMGVWDRELTENEQIFLFNSGAGRSYPFP